MKVALVHDYLREYGGAERVVEALHEIWPEAPLYTSFVDWQALGIHRERFANWNIVTSWVQHNPLVKKLHSPLRFLAPRIWESFDLSNYDVVISSSGWFICRGVRTGEDAGSAARLSNLEKTRRAAPSVGLPARKSDPLHICYIHHPPRNLYGYATGSSLQKYWPVRAYATLINFFMRHYDFATAQKVDYFIANSQETARRVWKFYRRESTVIYPPVEATRNKQKAKSKKDRSYYLSVGRLAWAKRVDLAIEAANQLKLPLKIVGTGPEEKSLKLMAGPTVEFLGAVSDKGLAQLYEGARSLIFTALEEDFGMVPVEAMAHGTPVIGLAQGGVVETVVDSQTGMLFSRPEVADLVAAIKRFQKIREDWATACQTQAAQFSKERFKKELKDFVEGKIAHARTS
ncbi:MAG: glycosyltransferase [Patescibacteria group bacterium]